VNFVDGKRSLVVKSIDVDILDADLHGVESSLGHMFSLLNFIILTKLSFLFRIVIVYQLWHFHIFLVAFCDKAICCRLNLSNNYVTVFD